MKHTETKLKRKGLQRLNSGRNYYYLTKQPSNINPVFLEDHYGIKKGVL